MEAGKTKIELLRDLIRLAEELIKLEKELDNEREEAKGKV